MFPLQQSGDDNELTFQILSNPCQQDQICQDLIMNYAIQPSPGTTIHHQLNHVKVIPKKKRLPTRVLGTNNNSHEITTDDLKLKKIVHRDMERQRRQGMASLHSSLRSLLPLHYVKGKRSVSDHMHEAVKYIKQLQENMKELERKREKLKIMLISNSSNNPCGRENGSSDSVSQHCVTVSPCQSGLEILINAQGNNLALSRVIQELMKQGLDVVTCVSANDNQNSLHKIQTEVRDMKCINVHALQRKLIDAIMNIDLE